ncbi:DEAD/DEAH box helicase family protein [Candidatus Woesearchaeota archaeon]|nr:DEAD/DEAH box helicase family protein [Candidatus Woesearchaeota archaeon]
MLTASTQRENHFITDYYTRQVMITNFEPRLYQQTILNTCIQKNTLVVLPTGMGKTSVAMMLAVHRLHSYPSSKILFLAPTRPLVDQHCASFQQYLNLEPNEFAVFTGFVRPEKRAEQWKEAKIIFSTPQGLENDIISGRIKLEEVSLLIIDEAHRATGDYAYVFVTKQYHKRATYPRILALTASPGSDFETIQEVCDNLNIEDIEIRTEHDPDVRPYIQDIKVEWVKVELPPTFKEIRDYLQRCYTSKLHEISKLGYLPTTRIRNLGKTEMLKLQAHLHGEIAQGNKDMGILRSVSFAAEAMKVQHALELAETQSLHALSLYLDRLVSDAEKTKVKAVQNLVVDVNFRSALLLVQKLAALGIEHPKLEKIKEIIRNTITEEGIKIILFTQYRDTASLLARELNKIDGVKAAIFVGQAKKGETGLSQKQQKALLEQFTLGTFNILIATSVAEEGLDIPKVDVVVFYEPIPSAIRHIQRRGRTGRLDKGKVIVLMTKDTRDEGYRWSAHHKEQRMHRMLQELKKKFYRYAPPAQITLHDIAKREELAPELHLTITVDDRERSSGIIKELIDQGVKIELKRLEIGDYLLSKRCCVEYKTVPDFVDSIIDGRLLVQIKELRKNFERPVIIIEGTEDVYSQRNLHPNAIRGMLATITVSYGIPIIQTKTFKETAGLLALITKREQEAEAHHYSPHGSKKPLSLPELQEYVVSALPGVGPLLAKPLLEKFGSIKNIVNASDEELMKIEKIGEKKAKEIQRVLTEKYEKNK